MAVYKKPNFFVIGAAKAGTTSLQHYLAQHPQVFISPIKEPNFFSKDIDTSKFTATYRRNNVLDTEKYFSEKPLKELHLSFVRKESDYFSLFEGVDDRHKAIGEFSTSYLYSTLAAGEIKAFNPEAKIIAVLRNPVSRAYSHYLMALRFGYTSLPFRKAVEADIAKKEKGWGISELFLELGMYYEQLKRYYDIFPEEHIRIYLTDTLGAQPQSVLSDLIEFLDVDPFIVNISERLNEGKIPQNALINKILVKSGVKNIIDKLLPSGSKQKLADIYFRNDKLPLISTEDKEFLLSIYRNDIAKTAELTKKDLSAWLS